ncbi:MAG: hypothetical protein JNM09_21425, partial [Blastocatellia bacterium]|nr:hypothetical protein [Blastocatellia bacterium]
MFPQACKFHATIVSLLSVSLIYAPLLALPNARTNIILPPLKPLPVPVIKAAHQPNELRLKFKDNAPADLQQQVRVGWRA